MEDPRCKIAAMAMEDSRCKGMLRGVEIEMEDPRCMSLPNRVSPPNRVLLEMEDPRCKIAAMAMEDPRCKGLLRGVTIEMEDSRRISLHNRVVLEIEAPRCKRVAIEMEEPSVLNDAIGRKYLAQVLYVFYALHDKREKQVEAHTAAIPT